MRSAYLIHCAFATMLAYPTVYARGVAQTTKALVAADLWTPAPIQAPDLFNNILSRRDDPPADSTCGFVSASSVSSITCSNRNAICVTNTYFGAHGCCDASALSLCTLATTCIPATAMPTACTNSACSSDNYTTKCTSSGLGECYQWLFVYGTTTTMTQHGCAASAFISTAYRTPGAIPTSAPDAKTVTVTTIPDNSPTTITENSSLPSSSKPSVGAIVGGTIGACVFLSLILFVAFLAYRKRKQHNENALSSYSNTPQILKFDGSSPTQSPLENKVWAQHGTVQWGANDDVPRYPGIRCGVVEVDGSQKPIEVDSRPKSMHEMLGSLGEKK